MESEEKFILEPELTKSKVTKKKTRNKKFDNGAGGDFFGLRLDEMFYFRGKYDYVAVNVARNSSYPIATLAARSKDALKSDGHLILDFDGMTYDRDNILGQIDFLGLELVEEAEGVMVLKK
jgi:hypothetical protein